MGSAEKSVFGEGRVVSGDKPDHPFPNPSGQTGPGRLTTFLRPHLGAILFATALVAVLSTALGVYDYSRTLDEVADDLRMLAEHSLINASSGETLGDLVPGAIVASASVDGTASAQTANATLTAAQLLDPSRFVSATAGDPEQATRVIASLPLTEALADHRQRLLLLGGSSLVVWAALVAFAVGLRNPGTQSSVSETGPIRHLGKATVLNQVKFGLARWDDRGQLVWCNPAYRTLMGLPANADLVGLTYEVVSGQAERPEHYTPVSELNDVRQTEARCADDTFLMVEEKALQDGGMLSVVTDTTEHHRHLSLIDQARNEQRELARRFHEEKLKAEAASRSKTAFLAHLSHDIRTPLNHIIGFADLMQHQLYGPMGDARYTSYVGDIKASGEKLLTSFAEIFDLAQLEAGETPWKAERIDIADLFEAMGDRYGDRAERAGLVFKKALPEKSMVLGDRHLLVRMLNNVLDNAMKFTPSGGQISLAAWTAEDGVVIEVTDTGIGIPEDRLSQLAQPFVLGESAFGKGEAGMGLGLAISRAVAELSGGSLVIDSTPAMGTTVAIALPLANAARQGSAAAA
ncbi:sensor histidine kinase [Cucumibacter marinus]|uniref:sensor histidine kinase n=1 Tax=Cucumibacter marinus TaxID=1121252 RepID=UPI00041F63EC|nr:PAS domain-containing sensor histidine kinase [Cucumibacter marinus]